MKLTWGNGIFLFLLLFTFLCVIFLVYTTTVDQTLVEDDYYPKGLKHEQVLTKMRNYTALPEPLSVQLSSSTIDVRFPVFFKGIPMNGRILVYRPSDKRLDGLFPLKPDTALVQSIPLSRFRRGDYVIKVDWSASGKGYYVMKDIFIP